MKRGLVAGLVVCGLFGSTAAFAQTCLGGASLQRSIVGVSGGMGFTTGARDAGALVQAGRDNAFGFGHLTSLTVDAANQTEYAVGGGAGFGTFLAADGRTQVCSTIDLQYEHGTTTGVTRVSAFETLVGLHLGFVALHQRSVAIVPTFGGGMQMTRAQATNQRTLAGVTTVERFGVASLGTGVIFHDQMSINANLVMPFARPANHPTFTLGFGYVFK